MGGLPLLQEFYQMVFWRKIHRSIAELPVDLDDWIVQRTNQSKMFYGRTPIKHCWTQRRSGTRKQKH